MNVCMDIMLSQYTNNFKKFERKFKSTTEGENTLSVFLAHLTNLKLHF